MLTYKPIIQPISSKVFGEKHVSVSVLRLDLIHETISGNKWFKLKNNLEEAQRSGHDTVLTFGGAFSNHIHATAAACNAAGFKSIGVIRGEEISSTNYTLSEARKMGMHLHFVTREEYRKKDDPDFIAKLKSKFGEFYLVPEGGNNLLGAQGCCEILNNISEFDHVFCACGTGTTFSGIASALSKEQLLIGVSVLKGEQSVIADSKKMIDRLGGIDAITIHSNESVMTGMYINRSGIINDYVFGGYARHTDRLLNFKNCFEGSCGIPLDYVYTSKLFYAVFDLVAKNKIRPDSSLLIIHSGGLQGNKGYEERYALNPTLRVNDPHGYDCFGLIPLP